MSTVPQPVHVPLVAWVPLLVWLIGIILAISVSVWVFQIRKATRETAEETKRLASTIKDIYDFLSKQGKR